MIALRNKTVAHNFLPLFDKKIIEIQKFCYHGNVTSHFSFLSWLQSVLVAEIIVTKTEEETQRTN